MTNEIFLEITKNMITSSKISFKLNYSVRNYSSCLSEIRKMLDVYSKVYIWSKFKNKNFKELEKSNYWVNDSARLEKMVEDNGWIRIAYLIGSAFTHLSVLYSNWNNKSLMEALKPLDNSESFRKFYSANAIELSKEISQGINLFHNSSLSPGSPVIDVFKYLPNIFKKIEDNAMYILK